MKRLFFVLVMFCLTLTSTASEVDWHEGDIVFQMSKSKQSPLIKYATMSPWTHCGIVIKKHDGFYVLEASNVVKLTPINDWVNRGSGKFCISRRVFKDPIKIQYSKYLGQKYDLAFKLNNGKMYCSELVYEIYKNQFGITLCKPKSISKYNTFGLKNIMRKRGIGKTQLFIAPSDLLSYKGYV